MRFTWAQMALEVARWQAALVKEGLAPGDRVAVMLRNCVEWVIFDQAALGLGLVTVPLYVDDRPDNAAYILDHSGAKLLLVDGKLQYRKLAEIAGSSPGLQRIVSLTALEGGLANEARVLWWCGTGCGCDRHPRPAIAYRRRPARQHCLHFRHHRPPQRA